MLNESALAGVPEQKYLGEYIAGRSESASPWSLGFPALVAAILVVAALAKLLLTQDPRVPDTPEFKRALAEWQHIVAIKNNTPRAVKRFVNRVRYLAMTERDAEPDDPWWWRAVPSVLKRKPKPAASRAADTAEYSFLDDQEGLVSHAAIHAVLEEDLSPEEFVKRFEKQKGGDFRDLRFDDDENTNARIKNVIVQLINPRRRQWAPKAEAWKRLRQISQGFFT